jgi:hypothetical protein
MSNGFAYWTAGGHCGFPQKAACIKPCVAVPPLRVQRSHHCARIAERRNLSAVFEDERDAELSGQGHACDPTCNFGSSLFGLLRSSTSRPLGSSAFDIFRGSALLFGISSLALPAWDQGMRRPNLTRVLIAPRRERYKSLSELTSSIVPRRTSIRLAAELKF